MPQNPRQETDPALIPGRSEQGFGRTFLENFAALHKDHPIRHLARKADLVGHADPVRCSKLRQAT